MKDIALKDDHKADIKFVGEMVASVSSYSPHGGPSYFRWTEFDLYRTQGGQYVCHKRGMSRVQGEKDFYTVIKARDDRALIDKIGYGRLVKEMYDQADIDHTERFD